MNASFARAVVLAWARCYTAGLDGAARAERLAELESDCFEHLRVTPGFAGSATLLLRCLLGVPADLSWRLEQSAPRGYLHAAAVIIARPAELLLRLAGAALAVAPPLLAAFYVLVALLIGAAALQAEPDPPWFRIVAPWALLAAALVVAGWRYGGRRPRTGALILAAGALPLGLALVATVVAVPLALAATGQALVRVVVAGRPRTAGNA
ncbi:hypothetical protein [Tepidiforma sp.]|uniref:hypothetical protein n=1 Tax=Tepidiforma sp. TaxID=2682230 RepID=UPI002ADD3C05|nr:hypothetical protein [Tepidiforma sp.]